MNDTRDTIVVLLSGLWTPAWVMGLMQRRIERAGLACVRFRYASARASLEQNAQRLADFVRALDAPRVYLVGHSLGGVIALHAAASHGLTQVRRIVMLGSPYRDSHAARALARRALGRWMLGRTLPAWLECAKPRVPEGVELGVLAGTSPLGLGMLVAPDLPRPHDGVVRTQETQVEGMTGYIEVPVNHIGMAFSARVAALTVQFLRDGRFEPTSRAKPVEHAAGHYALDPKRGA